MSSQLRQYLLDAAHTISAVAQLSGVGCSKAEIDARYVWTLHQVDSDKDVDAIVLKTNIIPGKHSDQRTVMKN